MVFPASVLQQQRAPCRSSREQHAVASRVVTVCDRGLCHLPGIAAARALRGSARPALGGEHPAAPAPRLAGELVRQAMCSDDAAQSGLTPEERLRRHGPTAGLSHGGPKRRVTAASAWRGGASKRGSFDVHIRRAQGSATRGKRRPRGRAHSAAVAAAVASAARAAAPADLRGADAQGGASAAAAAVARTARQVWARARNL